MEYRPIGLLFRAIAFVADSPLLCQSSFLLLSVCSTSAQDVFTVGGDERPWRDSGTTPGGVIDFVEQLGAIEDADGEKVFTVGLDSLQNWIMPLRLRADFNISLGVLERGGSIDVPGLDASQKSPEQLEGMLNGDHRVAFDRKFVAGRIVRNNGVTIRVDLGARFGVDRIVFYPRMTESFPFGHEFMRGYELFLNDGLPQNLYASGQPIFTSPVQRDLRQPRGQSGRTDHPPICPLSATQVDYHARI